MGKSRALADGPATWRCSRNLQGTCRSSYSKERLATAAYCLCIL